MKTPYEQGYDTARQGLEFEQIYDQRGEELEADAYARGYNQFKAKHEQQTAESS